jgi:glycerophosphoryl diester phosphodiesterase
VSFLNIAHRGASLDAPENTLEAFRLAVTQGADMIETDLHLTRDHAVPLHHDSALDGEEIGGLRLEELRERAPSVPTLEEALDLVRDRVPFNLELKHPAGGEYEGLEARVLDEIGGRGLVQRTLFSSFRDAALVRIRELEPKARIGLLVSERAEVTIEERALRVRAESVHLHWRRATRERIQALHAQGFRVYVYTVDDPEEQRRLLGEGVDGIFTNVPARLRALVSTRSGRGTI